MAAANVATWVGISVYNNRLLGNAAAQPIYIGWGYANNDTGSLISDVNLFYPGLELRATGTPNLASANQLGDTYILVGTITANNTRTVGEVGIFDSSSLSPTGTTNSTAANATTTTVGLIGATGSTGLPSAGVFYAQWDNEVVAVTAGQNSNTLTVTRGALGSTAAAHSASVPFTAGGDGGSHAANSSIGVATWVPSGANGGNMFVHADFANVGLSNNDSIQFTLKTQLS